MADVTVRIGELVASAEAGTVLAALGLGSCVGVVLTDRGAGVAGLAHVMLPEARRPDDLRGADVAVPELLSRVLAAGGRRHRLEVAVVGGAQMFSGEQTLRIGVRNDLAVRAALKRVRLTVAAEATGGTQGRTVRVEVGGEVAFRAAGGSPVPLLGAGALV